jgi:prephenate dehydrogenase
MHDRVLAAGSHLPHVTAYALAGVLGRLASEQVEALKRLPTTSLRDTTRVSASSPAMWRDILLDNRDEVLPLVAMLQAEIEALRAAIDAADPDRIESILQAGKKGRDRIIPS